ncbi:MAG: site-specific DNA-methyltransferase [Candidatus Poribacteria bacterium]|nr:site-specific DNA-methyltransferase [Candidatus Poribacteria bacterium]
MARLDKVERLTPSAINERIKVLKKMFPEFFTEGKIDVPKLKEVVGEDVDDAVERYRFTWAGKRDAIQLLQTPTRATLTPCEEESVDFKSTGNIFIEGDNLEVLKLLYKPYFGKVKAIYIDPPYNRGGDYVYNDNYTDPLNTYLQLTAQKDEEGNRLTSNVEKSGRYHSSWLSMMYPRLFLARQLLRSDGIIFVSIDDYEIHNLRMLMNEVFGEENLFQQVVWQRHAGGGNNAKHFAVDHEYILVYAKNKQDIPTLKLPLSDKQKAEYTEKDEWYSTLGPYKVRSFPQNRPANPRPGLQYHIELPDGTKVFDQWKWQESRFLEAKAQNKMVFTKDNNGKWRVGYKKYLNESDRLPRSLLTQVERNVEGKKQLSAVLEEPNILNNPKPVGLIKHLLEFSTDPDSLVVDFFAGSCTTAQAVLELNRADNGNRKFIVVQLPEPTPEKSIARNAGYETISDIGMGRIQRLLNKMRTGNLFRAAEDLGVKVFKLTESNYRQWNGVAESNAESYENQLRLFADNPLVDQWIPKNVIYEVSIKEGYQLDCLIKQVDGIKQNTIFQVSSRDEIQTFYICLDAELFQDEIDKLKLTNDHLLVCLDKALDDTQVANLALQCRLKTI